VAEGYARDIRQGVVAALKANAGVTALVGQRVMSKARKDTPFPYVVVSGITPSAFNTTCTRGALVGVGIHIYSRSAQGDQEAEEIAERIVDALDRQETSITLEDHNLVEFIFQTFVSDDTPKENEAAVRMSFQAMIEATA
jgi:hypothetical protein